MFGRVAWLLAIVGLVYIGFRAVQGFYIQLQVQQTEQEVPIEEQILLDNKFFYPDFGKRKVVHLRTFSAGESPLLDGLSEPRPELSSIKAQHGEPDNVATEDLSPYGVHQTAVVYSYGRLGLAMPVSKKEGKIFWLLLR